MGVHNFNVIKDFSRERINFLEHGAIKTQYVVSLKLFRYMFQKLFTENCTLNYIVYLM
jgi:hypothetical protein